MNEALVSVIIPTYNWSEALKKSIKTALWQSYKNIEILVIGDCCTDDSEQVVKSFNDERVKWHNLEKNSGSQSIPNNYGIKIAKGEFIAHLGHDDIWHPQHIEFLIKKTNDADFCYSLSLTVGPDDEETVFKNLKKFNGICAFENKENKLLFIPPSSWLYRKSIIEKMGSWTHYKDSSSPPDDDFLLRVNKFYKNRTACSEKLSVVKFPSAWRENSYIRKPVHQQQKFIEEIEKNNNLLDHYLIAYLNLAYKRENFKDYLSYYASFAYKALSYYFYNNRQINNEMSNNSNLEKGSVVEQSRNYRGLNK